MPAAPPGGGPLTGQGMGRTDPPTEPSGTMPDDVAEALQADAAARARLETYVALLLKWQRAINLVAGGGTADIWHRHILDCGQLRRFIPAGAAAIADLGSGGGLPGLVLAALGVEGLTLVESDGRKAAFLREANRAMGTGAVIVNKRAEDLPPKSFDLITSRALAPLARLVPLAENLLKTGGKLLFLKGKSAEEELTACAETWKMTVTKTPSLTDSAGVVLLIEDVEKRHG